MSTTYLDLEDLLALADDLGVLQVRDLGLLASAAQRPATSLYGEEVYPDVGDKPAVVLESIVRNHPLIDGNKRLGWLSTLVFLGLNGVDLDVEDGDAYELVISVAEGRRTWRETAVWMAEHGVS
ncbi:type II toxin-antitoxin system death-on-curing family toxin [Actinomyces radicidentis]|uniref:type II toxin-antitoxin system death-on-curing family toxin n=1 Tax=Actinomyces radicidentis TaxID=111015 RepID=UPI0026DF3B56|nr:Fic family protein [Actinomyces radicidentis]